MKKSLKRILCGAMSLMMASSLVAEHWLRSDAEEAVGQSVTAEAAFENVTGQYDTAALRESYFNSGALKTRSVGVGMLGGRGKRGSGERVRDELVGYDGSAKDSFGAGRVLARVG